MNSDNIQVARPRATGVAFVADAGTSLPSDADTALGVAFTDLGYVSEDGITETYDKSSELLKEMGGAPVLVLNTAQNVEYKFTLLEQTADGESLVLGAANVTTDSDGNLASAVINGDEVAASVFVFDMRLRGGLLFRIVIPNGAVTSVGDVVYKAGSAASREYTISCMPDSSGNRVYKYWDAS